MSPSYRTRKEPPFYRRPSAIAWTIIAAMGLLLVLYLVEMGG